MQKAVVSKNWGKITVIQREKLRKRRFKARLLAAGEGFFNWDVRDVRLPQHEPRCDRWTRSPGYQMKTCEEQLVYPIRPYAASSNRRLCCEWINPSPSPSGGRLGGSKMQIMHVHSIVHFICVTEWQQESIRFFAQM